MFAIAFGAPSPVILLLLAIPALPIACAAAFYRHRESPLWGVMAHLSVVVYWFLTAGLAYLAK